MLVSILSMLGGDFTSRLILDHRVIFTVAGKKNVRHWGAVGYRHTRSLMGA